MEKKDHYLTVAGASFGEFKDRGSKFMAYVYPVRNEKEVEDYLVQIKKEHLKARHHCYAYKIGQDDNRYRANDDGEPSGTAGKPILGQINSFDLSDTLIIVVRYFGGTKLGTSGLINAYRTAARIALEEAEIREEVICDRYVLRFSYENMGAILNAIKSLNIRIDDKKFEETAEVKIEIRKSISSDKIRALKAKILGKSIEEITEESKVGFCGIELLE